METKNETEEEVVAETPTPSLPEEPEKLLQVLLSLESLITKQTSLRFAFLRGAVYGLGTVIGATLLIALVGGILVSTINSLADWPIIGSYIEKNASEYLEEIDSQ